MSLYYSAGALADSDWVTGSNCGIYDFKENGTAFNSMYGSTSYSGGNYADSGVGFLTNGIEIREWIGDKSVASVQATQATIIGVGGISTQIP